MSIPPEYQPIAGITDLNTVASIQDHFNRAILDWMTQQCRLIVRQRTTAPGSGDDIYDGVTTGTIWVDETNNKVYINLDNSPGSALWQEVGAGGGAPAVSTATVLSTGIQSSVAASTLTTVVSYAAVADTKITEIFCSGQDNAKWQVFIDSTLKITQRASNGDRSLHIDFDTPLLLSNGSTLDVKVTHFFTGDTLDFESSILGFT